MTNSVYCVGAVAVLDKLMYNRQTNLLGKLAQMFSVKHVKLLAVLPITRQENNVQKLNYSKA